MSLQYLPGEQLRKVVLTDKQLCFGLAQQEQGAEEGQESNNIMLDYIPLHEIIGIRQGHEDIPQMFEMFDKDSDGILTLQELTDGLAMYGLSPAMTKAMFFPERDEVEQVADVDDDFEDGASSQGSSGMFRVECVELKVEGVGLRVEG